MSLAILAMFVYVSDEFACLRIFVTCGLTSYLVEGLEDFVISVLLNDMWGFSSCVLAFK